MQLKALEPLPHAEGNFDVKYDMKDGWKPMDPKERANVLAKEFDWDKGDALKIWSFGPENQGANILCDATKGV